MTFGARTLVLMGEMAPHEVPDWLSGCSSGAKAMRAHGCSTGLHCARSPVGADELLARYSAAMTQAGMAVEMAPADAAALGLWRIAQHASLIPASVH
jgi:2-keto-3-deoxy-galactonokinase